MSGGAKIPLDAQIAAVRQSALSARAVAASPYDGWARRAAHLDAAVRSLLCANRERLAGAARPADTKAGEKRRFSELPLAQQAALRCAEGAFHKFVRAGDADGAAAAVRARCGVASRAEFDRDAAAGARWRALDRDYRAWLDCRIGDD